MAWVHRLIILDDVAPSYTLRPRQLRFKKFFSWSLFLWACVGVFEVVFTLLFGFLLLLSGGGAFFISIFVFPAFIFIFSFILCWAMARLSILFPAIAVDAAGASWRNVMSDTRGYAWQIFLIALLASLPFVPVGIALWFSVGHGTVAAVTDGVLGIISITLFVVIASRLYQRLGNNVNQSRAV